MKKIALEYYIAYNNPRAASELVASYGLPKAKNVNDMAHKLHKILLKYREDALNKFAEIHPDRELILNILSDKNVEDKHDEKSGACGCSGASGSSGGCGCGCGGKCGGNANSGFYGADGSAPAPSPNPTWESMKPYVGVVAVGAILAIGLTLALK